MGFQKLLREFNDTEAPPKRIEEQMMDQAQNDLEHFLVMLAESGCNATKPDHPFHCFGRLEPDADHARIEPHVICPSLTA